MRLLLLILAMFSAQGAMAAILTPVCFDVTWKSNYGPGPKGIQKPGPQKFITINRQKTVDFYVDNSRKIEYDSYGKPVWSYSRGCAQPSDFRIGKNTIEFSFIIGEGELISEGWLSVWVNVFLPNKTSPVIGFANYHADPQQRQWSMVRSLELDLAALAPELDAQAKQSQLELWRLNNETQIGEVSFDRSDRDYELVLSSLRDKDFFAISLEDLAVFQEASNRYQFVRKDLEAKKAEITRRTEALRLATEAAKTQLEAAARSKGFDLTSEQLLGPISSLSPLGPFSAPGGTDAAADYPYASWAAQSIAAMKADLELGLRDQFLLKALAWQERVGVLLNLLQARSDLSKAELNAFESAVAEVNAYLFGDGSENQAGIISKNFWFNDLGLDPGVTLAIDGELATQRPELAKRLKAAINELSSTENLVFHIKAAATLAQMYKAAQNEAEAAFLDKMMLGATAMIEAAPSIGACITKNLAAGPYADFYELYYEVDFCSGKPNDEVDRSLVAGNLLLEAGSLLFLGPLGPWAVDKLEVAVKFFKRMLDVAQNAAAARSWARLEKIRDLAGKAFEQRLLKSSDDLRALAKGMPEIDAEMVEKILRGVPKARGKEIIGVHSPNVLKDDSFFVDEVSKNLDGTISCFVQKKLSDGNISKRKRTKLFPEHWSDEKIINAGRIVAGSQPIAKRSVDEAFLHRVIIDGVEVIALREGSKITSVFPTGEVGKMIDDFLPL